MRFTIEPLIPAEIISRATAVQQKYSKLLAALDKARLQAADDAEYREGKFPAIEEKFTAAIQKLEAELGISGDAANKPEGEA